MSLVTRLKTSRDAAYPANIADRLYKGEMRFKAETQSASRFCLLRQRPSVRCSPSRARPLVPQAGLKAHCFQSLVLQG